MIVAMIVTRTAIVMPTVVMMIAVIVMRLWRWGMSVPAVIPPFIVIFPPAMITPVTAIPIAPAIILIANL